MAKKSVKRVNVSTTFDTYCPRSVCMNGKCIRYIPQALTGFFLRSALSLCSSAIFDC